MVAVAAVVILVVMAYHKDIHGQSGGDRAGRSCHVYGKVIESRLSSGIRASLGRDQQGVVKMGGYLKWGVMQVHGEVVVVVLLYVGVK